MKDIAMKALYTLISLFVILNYGLLLTGTMARVRAKVQGRIGQPVYQPYIDILKNNFLRTSIYHGVMFFLGPVFRLAGGLGTYLFIPVIFGSTIFSNFAFSGDLLLVMYFIFFGQLGMALGAGQSGHPYSPIGVSRGLAQMTAFEVPFALAVISIASQYGTLSITGIVAAQQGGILHWVAFTNPLAMVAGMIAGFLGMLQTNRAIFNGAKLVLFMNLFFGGAGNLLIMVIKTFLLYFYVVFVGASFPRFRPDQSIRFFLGIPTLIGIAAVVLQMV
jgi:NADH-quinone oxidoreductase subunit H